ncbi:MAG: DegV family EDD domain-containing protein [Candidatus Hydrothermae bacterium]|nr:DegV family EDD domain-containing protein [Candidatus Hydrothermae bacterium]
MVLKLLDSEKFRNAILTGASRLIKNVKKLNSINVFPVPDGDTGTNLALTLKGATRRIKDYTRLGIGAFARRLADALVLEAKGNSGVIFSQFLLEFADRIGDKARMSSIEFARAMREAIDATYNALEDPREGTILTVIREVALEAERAAEETDDLVEVLERSLRKGKEALEKTPELLPELKAAGVVDAGGLGFILFIEGMLDSLKSGILELPYDEEVEALSERVEEAEYRGEHRYCTEAVVEAEGLESRKLRKILAALGGSLIVIGAGKLFHVHIHTNWPHKVFEILRERGRVLKEKVDDLFAMSKLEEAEVGIVTDSTCDLPPELARERRITVVPIKVVIDGRSYDDGVDVSRDRISQVLREGRAELTTSQPGPNDFMVAFEEVSRWARSILVITISGALSGTFRSAQIAAKAFDRVPIRVVDSRSASLGIGLLALRAAELADRGLRLEEIADELEALRNKIFFLFTVGDFRNLVRSGRVSKVQGRLADFLGLKPILTLDSEGRIRKKTGVFGESRVLSKFRKLLSENLDKAATYDFAVVHFGAAGKIDPLQEFLEEAFNARMVLRADLTPALSLHVGPGSWGVFALPVD